MILYEKLIFNEKLTLLEATNQDGIKDALRELITKNFDFKSAAALMNAFYENYELVMSSAKTGIYADRTNINFKDENKLTTPQKEWRRKVESALDFLKTNKSKVKEFVDIVSSVPYLNTLKELNKAVQLVSQFLNNSDNFADDPASFFASGTKTWNDKKLVNALGVLKQFFTIGTRIKKSDELDANKEKDSASFKASEWDKYYKQSRGSAEFWDKYYNSWGALKDGIKAYGKAFRNECATYGFGKPTEPDPNPIFEKYGNKLGDLNKLPVAAFTALHDAMASDYLPDPEKLSPQDDILFKTNWYLNDDYKSDYKKCLAFLNRYNVIKNNNEAKMHIGDILLNSPSDPAAIDELSASNVRSIEEIDIALRKYKVNTTIKMDNAMKANIISKLDSIDKLKIMFTILFEQLLASYDPSDLSSTFENSDKYCMSSISFDTRKKYLNLLSSEVAKPKEKDKYDLARTIYNKLESSGA